MVADWVVVELEPAGAARSGLPARLAVPREVAERGDPIERVRAAEWARAFVAGHADHELAADAARDDDGRAVPPAGRAPDARGALRGGRPGARPRDRADAVRRRLALQSRGRAAARGRAGARARRRSTRPSGPTAASPPTTCCAAASGRRWTSRRAPCWPTSARSSSRPATASCWSGSRHLGALHAHRGARRRGLLADARRFRARDAPRARVGQQRSRCSSSRSATACWAAATSRSRPPRPSSRWPAARTLPGAWALAGLTRAALGRDLQAREALGRAAALDPSNVAVARALVQREDDPEGDLPRAHAEVQRRPGLRGRVDRARRLAGRRGAAPRGARRLCARARPGPGAAGCGARARSAARARLTTARRYASVHLTPRGPSRSSRRRERHVTPLRTLAGR